LVQLLVKRTLIAIDTFKIYNLSLVCPWHRFRENGKFTSWYPIVLLSKYIRFGRVPYGLMATKYCSATKSDERTQEHDHVTIPLKSLYFVKPILEQSGNPEMSSCIEVTLTNCTATPILTNVHPCVARTRQYIPKPNNHLEV
jgi:hypothetical protein